MLRARRRGTVYPYELTGMLAGPGGTFTEYDLDDAGALVPVDRPQGHNRAGDRRRRGHTPTERYPEGITRVVLLGDPTKALGALSEPECARVIAALDLAEQMRVPLEWFALSAGARISMDSGTENMDWVAAALQAGSSSSPRTAARSTSSSPASTSAPSRTGTPRRRC